MRYVIAIVGLVTLLGALAGLKAAQIKTLVSAGEQAAKAGPPPEVVSTAIAKDENWQGQLNAVASVVSSRGVALSNDAAGVVSRIHFESGAHVQPGQVLVELDSSVERAQLRSSEARLKLAEVSLERSRNLVSKGVVSQSQLDNDESTYNSLVADVGALRAQIERKTIRAPFAGKLGLREVNLGQYLAPGTSITTLEAIRQMFIDFSIPQENLEQIKVGMPVRASEQRPTEPGEKVPYVEGKISAIDPALDEATRNVRVRATFANESDQLRPGMFVRVSVLLPEAGVVVVVPATAIVHASFGDSVFIVEEKPGTAGKPASKVVRQQFVRLGDARGDFVAITQGVTAGQEVVTSGAFKLRNGASVVVDNQSVKLEPKLAPRPENN